MGKVHPVRNPWSGQIDYQFEQLGAAAVLELCARLKNNQAAWANAVLADRLAALDEFRHALRQQQHTIVAALIEDTGRERIAAIEFELLIQTIDRVIRDAPGILGVSGPSPTSVESINASQQHVPYGLMLNIAPWNFPLLLSFLDAVPALATGNAVVIKPSEIAPRWIEPVQAALAAVPTIEAVLAILPGDGEHGTLLMQHADVVSFTGSVPSGRRVNETAAKLFIPAYLELGGKDPAIVLASADQNYAAATIVFSAMSASGQACQSLELALVDTAIYPTFVERAVEQATRLTINYPDRGEGFVGPFIMDSQADIVAEQLRDASSKGARILCGGEILEHGGRWLEPTIVVDVTPEMRIMQEETFGPVLTVSAVANADEAITIANSSNYGLSASVFAGTLDEARDIGRQLNAGAINLNDASLTSRVHDVAHESFGLSGLGRSRFGSEGYLRYVRSKAILENDSGTSVVAG
jgi:succinate-semialdehyde dehydrogenase/glutarate-semialdehyde dehydrogenase